MGRDETPGFDSGVKRPMVVLGPGRFLPIDPVSRRAFPESEWGGGGGGDLIF